MDRFLVMAVDVLTISEEAAKAIVYSRNSQTCHQPSRPADSN
jgi:hypothetical protein